MNYKSAKETCFEPDVKIISILIETGLFIFESQHGVEWNHGRIAYENRDIIEYVLVYWYWVVFSVNICTNFYLHWLHFLIVLVLNKSIIAACLLSTWCDKAILCPWASSREFFKLCKVDFRNFASHLTNWVVLHDNLTLILYGTLPAIWYRTSKRTL